MAEAELITLDEASRRFGVPIPTLRFWRYTGKIRRLKQGNRVLVDAEEVRKRVEESQQIREDK